MPRLYKKRSDAGEPKSASTIFLFPNDGEGDAVPWLDVGILEPAIQDGHVVPAWKPLGEGDSWEEAFADADVKKP